MPAGTGAAKWQRPKIEAIHPCEADSREGFDQPAMVFVLVWRKDPEKIEPAGFGKSRAVAAR